MHCTSVVGCHVSVMLAPRFVSPALAWCGPLRAAFARGTPTDDGARRPAVGARARGDDRYAVRSRSARGSVRDASATSGTTTGGATSGEAIAADGTTIEGGRSV